MAAPSDNPESNSEPFRSPADGIDTLKPQLPNDGASLNRKSSRTASAQDPSLAPTDVSPERPKKKRSLLLRPSRSSSKLNRHSTGETTAAEESGNTDANMTEKRTDTSRASSRRSRRTHQETVSNAEGPRGSTPDVDNPSKADKKSRTSLRLFAFLNCCSSSSVDNEGPALPPKKNLNPQPVHRRQTTPEKVDANAGDSSTSESKEPHSFDDEKTNLTVTAGRPQSQAEDEKRASVGEQGAATRPQDDGTLSGVDGSGSVNDQPSSQGRKPAILDQGSSQTLPSSTSMKAGVTAGADSTDVFTKIPEEDVVSSARVQASEDVRDDTDVLMAEAPVIDDSVEDDEAQPSHDGIMQQHADLPPPPPLVPSGKPAPPGSLDGRQQWLLPPPQPHLQNRKCLVLDLDETLVHSSFKVLDRADFTIPVEIEGQYHNIYVIKRPGVDQFMKRVGELYEVVVFTASVSKYGDPLLDQLDIHHVVHHRLFRDSCYNHQGNYVKDLSQVGRDLRETIIIDNSPTSYIFHPQHAIPISSWFSDAHDNELLDLIPVLEDLAGSQVPDVSLVLDVAL
ncbi:hypothetical protein VTN00DRAFT_7823 [Thermoascus crustaceus]|uniref:uncharacterized protein n=1 Tax=Thermoascus crustaceus TaxID=5088 RepID=UPI003742C785